MVEVQEIHEDTALVSFRTPWGALTIIRGKIRAEMGQITPAERKSCYKQYHAIIKTR